MRPLLLVPAVPAVPAVLAVLAALAALLLPPPALAAPPAPWGLDRIDQRSLPLDGSYRPARSGAGVTVYVVDSGIRMSAKDLGGRARTGIDEVDGGEAGDCTGHGTHVAGTIAGTRYGVAKGARLVSVRVVDCHGRSTEARVRHGLSWVLVDHAPGQPAVLNMSLAGAPSAAIDTLVKELVQDGIVVVLAAGNGDPWGQAANACDFSPGRVPIAITVSATDRRDTKPAWANTGSCVDLFAPGVDITSSWGSGDTATKTLSGTSMAAPAVAGAAALYLSNHRSATPAQVRAALVKAASTGKVIGHASAPNRLLRVT